MRKYKVGVIGYGWVAGAHIAAIQGTGRGEVRAVHSSRPLNAREVSERHGSAIECYRDLDMMLKTDLDVITVCSYPQQHAEHAIAVAKAGKHLILEKPVALSWEECEAVAKAVADAGVSTCVCFECRFSNQFVTTKSIIDAGWLGDLHYGEIDYYHGIGPWYGQFRWNTKKEAGGSSLLSAGCHAVDALLYCLGSDVEEVVSYATRSSNEDFARYEYPTTSVTLVRFKGGKVGKVASVIDALQPYYFHTHLVGSQGSLLDDKFHSNRISGLNKAKWSELSMKLLDSGDVSDHPYETQFGAFFGALDSGRAMPLTDLKEALKAHRVIFAADESAATGKPVRLDLASGG